MSTEDRSYFAHRHLLSPPILRAAYSDRTAWIMGQLSQLAYIEFEGNDEESAAHLTGRLRTALAAGGFELLETFDAQVAYLQDHAESQAAKGLEEAAKTDTQAILVRSEDMAVLAFRGSEPNKVDWLYTDADAKFIKLPEGEGRIHRGFYESFLSVRQEIEHAINRLPADLPLYVTGHSLGGALANVAGMELEKRRRLAAIYSFGSPRVGDEVWASRMKVPHYRTVNGRDIVPLLPFSSLLGNVLRRLGLGRLVRRLRQGVSGYIGYQHVGNFHHLTQDGRMLIGSSATLSRLGDVLLDAPVAVVRRSLRSFGVAMKFGTDHIMSNYIAKLEKIALERNPTADEAPRLELPAREEQVKKVRAKVRRPKKTAAAKRKA